MNAPNAVSLVPPQILPLVLPFALPWLEKTLREFAWENWTLENIIEDLQGEKKQLWAGHVGEDYLYVITQLVEEVTGISVHVVLGGGTLDAENSIIQHIAAIEQWARNIRATSVVVWGRLGWKKLLAPYGYQFDTAAFRLPLKGQVN